MIIIGYDVDEIIELKL